MFACATCQHGRNHVCHVGIQIDGLVVQERFSSLHHLQENEQVLHAVCDLFSNKGQKVGGQLVYAGLRTDSSESRILPFDIGLVGESAR